MKKRPAMFHLSWFKWKTEKKKKTRNVTNQQETFIECESLKTMGTTTAVAVTSVEYPAKIVSMNSTHLIYGDLWLGLFFSFLAYTYVSRDFSVVHRKMLTRTHLKAAKIATQTQPRWNRRLNFSTLCMCAVLCDVLDQRQNIYDDYVPILYVWK